MSSVQPGCLWVVATPIGHRDDLSARAIETLRAASVIAAEDTRHSRPLLIHHNIDTPLIALHDHNERDAVDAIVRRMAAGDSVALVSDAGTPLISDPGFRLVRAARAAGIRCIPIPGACAAIAALSVAGLPSDRFVFEGFLPAKAAARRSRLQELAGDGRTLIFYESSHRVADSLDDMRDVFGGDRDAVLARELTKMFETVLGEPLADTGGKGQGGPRPAARRARDSGGGPGRGGRCQAGRGSAHFRHIARGTAAGEGGEDGCGDQRRAAQGIV